MLTETQIFLRSFLVFNHSSHLEKHKNSTGDFQYSTEVDQKPTKKSNTEYF